MTRHREIMMCDMTWWQAHVMMTRHVISCQSDHLGIGRFLTHHDEIRPEPRQKLLLAFKSQTSSPSLRSIEIHRLLLTQYEVLTVILHEFSPKSQRNFELRTCHSGRNILSYIRPYLIRHLESCGGRHRRRKPMKSQWNFGLRTECHLVVCRCEQHDPAVLLSEGESYTYHQYINIELRSYWFVRRWASFRHENDHVKHVHTNEIGMWCDVSGWCDMMDIMCTCDGVRSFRVKSHLCSILLPQ